MKALLCKRYAWLNTFGNSCSLYEVENREESLILGLKFTRLLNSLPSLILKKCPQAPTNRKNVRSSGKTLSARFRRSYGTCIQPYYLTCDPSFAGQRDVRSNFLEFLKFLSLQKTFQNFVSRFQALQHCYNRWLNKNRELLLRP